MVFFVLEAYRLTYILVQLRLLLRAIKWVKTFLEGKIIQVSLIDFPMALSYFTWDFCLFTAEVL